MSADRRRPGADMPALTHQQAEELISNLLDGPLDDVSQRSLDAHLAGCATCGYFAAQMGIMGAGLRELPRLPASPTVSRQVRERIQQPVTLWDRLSRIFSGQLGLAPIAATATLLVAVVAGALLLNDDGNGTADNPTVEASTQLSIDRTLTSTRATGEPSPTPPRGTLILTATPDQTPLPNILFVAPSSTPTNPPEPTATETAVPTETPVPEDTVPAATNEPTETATPVTPTETATEQPPTEVPAATDVPTDTPTQEPSETPTEVSTEVPATELPTEVPTETATEEPEPTEVPTDTPTTEPDTATPEPEPTERGAPTIGPIDGGPIEGTNDETPVEQPTDEPVVDPSTETPVADPDGGDDELTIEPVGTTTVVDDPIETPDGGTGGPIVETATEVVVIEDETPDDGGDDGAPVAILDDTSRISTLDGDTSAPVGQLAFSPDQSLMVVSNADGSSLRIVDIQSGQIVQELGAGQYPEWSPLGGILLFNDLSEGSTVNAWFRESNDLFSISDSDVEEGGYADVPAGWFDSTAYYLRIYDDGGLSLRAYDAGVGATVGEIWGSDDLELAGVRPFQTSTGFLIPTADRWLRITPDGGAQELDGNALGFVGDGLLSPDGSLLAISASDGLYVVAVDSPNDIVAQMPYQETAGAGFSWSPDDAYIAISDGSSISVYTAGGDPVGAATSDIGVSIAGPQFQVDGIYFVQTSGEPSLRRFDLNRLLP